jgi:transmembrane sensor
MDKTCTPEEKDEFFSLLLHARHDDQLRRLIADTWNEDLPSYPQDKARADVLLQQIIDRGQSESQANRESASPTDPQPAVVLLRPRSRSLVLGRRTAAVIAILVISSLLFHALHHRHTQPPSVLPAIVAAKHSPPTDRCIALPDGSKVLLHKDARLDFHAGFTASRREVTLHGEAYFDIHRDSRPFVVHTGAIRTTVLGTAFNIDAGNQRQIVITVTKGKVKVENGRGEVSILRRNEQLSVDSAHLHLQKSTVDAVAALTWKKSYWLFNDIPLHQALDELSQRYHLSIVYTNPAAANCPVTASFTAGESVEAMIEVLAKINNMSFSIDHGRITITGEGCN